MTGTKRLLSLDVLRGITICGMILANNAGACGFGYAPLRHARWDGFNPADLVFPMFMFLMGISTFISLQKYNFSFRASIGKILKRTLVLIAIGIVMKWLISGFTAGVWNDWEHLRIMGVMQRLGICYGITALLAVSLPHRFFTPGAILLLAAYLVLQIFGSGFEKCADNIVAIVDAAVLGSGHMYLGGRQFIDPEGVLSTIPAVAQVMLGFACGKVLMTENNNRERLLHLFVAGTIMLFAGFLLSYGCPLNKRLWSPSFVLVTSGVASLLFALLLKVIDVDGHKKWSPFFQVFGVNPLFLYVTSEIFGDLFRHWNVTGYLFDIVLQPLFGDYAGSLMYAILFLLVLWLAGYVLYKKKILIKI